MFEKAKRFLNYYRIKIVRDKGTPDFIARGWAIGMFIGFAIPFGLQLVISVPLSYLLKGSRLGAVLGTFVTNHFTIFVIYPIQCWVGNRIIAGSLSFRNIEKIMAEVMKKGNYETLFNMGLEVVVSFFIGGLLFAIVSTPVCYFIVKRFVINYRRMKEKMRARKNAAENDMGKQNH